MQAPWSGEAKLLALSLYNVFFTAIVGVPIIFFLPGDSVNALFIIKSLLILFATVGPFLLASSACLPHYFAACVCARRCAPFRSCSPSAS
jgi:hypothetical protein